jgi:hypothetical protein
VTDRTVQHAFRCFEPFVSYAMPRPLWGGHPSRMTGSQSSNGGEAPILAVSNTVAGPPCASRRPDACSRMVNVLTTGAVKQREVTDPITTAAALNSLLRPDSRPPSGGRHLPLAGIYQRWQPCAAIPSPDGLRLLMSRVISLNVCRCPRLQRAARPCMYLCRLQSITVSPVRRRRTVRTDW